MSRVTGVLLITLLTGSLAIPTPEIDKVSFHDSDFFIHADSGARIVGGTPAPEGSVPYMVALSNGALARFFVCGGSIITARTVLTAAHCNDAVLTGGILTSNLRLHVGTNRWNEGGQVLTASHHVSHPQYDPVTIKNDIGVLITSSNINFNARVAAVPLGTDWVGANVQSRVAGWGITSIGGPPSQDLLELRVSTLDGDRCASEVARVAAALNVRSPHIDDSLEICTFLATNQGICTGDSGSALVRLDRNQQIGVVSWGFPCARGAPDMFVRVSSFINWIRNHSV